MNAARALSALALCLSTPLLMGSLTWGGNESTEDRAEQELELPGQYADDGQPGDADLDPGEIRG